LRLLDHLFEILLTALWRRLLLALVGEVCCLYSHFPHRSLDSKSEVRVVKHLNRKADRFRSKVDNQRIALELSLIVFVHLDSRFAAVNLFRNDATFCECMFDLVDVCIQWYRGDINGSVDSRFLGLLGRLLLETKQS
jgi:hypothetical protein